METLGWFVAAMLLVTLACGAVQAADEVWKAGVARCDITPQDPLWLAGYGSRDHEAEGAIHPLWAKALALQDAAGHRAVLVTSDLLGFPKAMSDRIRDRLKESFKLSRADIILNGSHTHSGPVLQNSLYNVYLFKEDEIPKIEHYSRTLEDQIVTLVGNALNNLAPARLSSANGVTRFAVNRRNNPEAQVLDNHDLKGPVDHAVPVLRVVKEDGALLAVVFGYACHSTVLCEYKWCGDYPGFAQIEIEAAHPGAMALFFAGCGADQNPLPRRTVPLAQQYGRELAAAVERTLTDPMKPLASTLNSEYAEIDLAFSPPPSHEELLQLVEKDTGFRGKAAKKFLAVLDQGKPLPATYPYPVQLWRVGDQPILTMGGEVVVDYAIAAKGILGADAFVMGFSNDLLGYVPSLRVLREGGYEGDTSQMEYDLPCKWAEDIESRITTAIRELNTRMGQ